MGDTVVADPSGVTDAHHDWASDFTGIDTRAAAAAPGDNSDDGQSGQTANGTSQDNSDPPQTTSPGQSPTSGQSASDGQNPAGGQTANGTSQDNSDPAQATSSGQAPSGGQSTSDGQDPAGGQTTSGGQDQPGTGDSSQIMGSLYYSISNADLVHLLADISAASGSVQDALLTEQSITSAGQGYGLDPTDRNAVATWLSNAKNMAIQDPAKADALGQVRTFHSKMEDLTRSINTLGIQIDAAKSHIANLKELKSAVPKEVKDSTSVGKGFEWFYDFANCAAQAFLDFDPAKAGMSLLKQISDMAGADVFKDHIQKLADELEKVESAMDQTVKGLQAFDSNEAATYWKELSKLRPELTSERSALVSASDLYYKALADLFKDSDNNGIAQQMVGAVRKAIDDSLSALNSTASSMSNSPLRDSKFQSAMVPLGDFGFESDSAIYYKQGDRSNGFVKGNGVGRAEVEQIAAGLTNASAVLPKLDAAIARVTDLSKMWNEEAAKAFGW